MTRAGASRSAGFVGFSNWKLEGRLARSLAVRPQLVGEVQFGRLPTRRAVLTIWRISRARSK
jgi:hypothetical protein